MSAFCTNTIFPKQANTWTVFWATVPSVVAIWFHSAIINNGDLFVGRYGWVYVAHHCKLEGLYSSFESVIFLSVIFNFSQYHQGSSCKHLCPWPLQVYAYPYHQLCRNEKLSKGFMISLLVVCTLTVSTLLDFLLLVSHLWLQPLPILLTLCGTQLSSLRFFFTV